MYLLIEEFFVTNPTNPTLKTPLFAAHQSRKAKMVPFGGWMMPVSYESVLAEHKTVREACGIFDVSHMGEIRVKGADAEKYLQWLTINDISKLKLGGGQYSAILNEDGGMIDDLIIYRLADQEYFICVNASNRDKDFSWFSSKTQGFNVQVTNESDQWAQIAVQGPNSLDVVSSVLPESAKAAFNALAYTNIMTATIFGEAALVARTGYTGEHGYELYVPNSIAERLWMALLELSAVKGVRPIGLGARDTLRLEACYLLYGNDMNDHVSPLEAGISWATKLDKGEFIGRAKLLEQKAKGVSRKIFAFKMTEDGIPRHGMAIYAGDAAGDMAIGEVTSGSVLPSVGGAGGMALLSSAVKEGDSVFVDIRGTRKKAQVVKRPLYSARTKT
jgi:aminomethyltransferase